MKTLILLLLLATLWKAGPATAQPDPAHRPKIGLVLSGGGARGGAHIGVLRVLEEMRVPVDVVVGTSAGAIVGAAYASGMPVHDIEREAAGLHTALLVHDVERADLSPRQKADQRLKLLGPEVGIGAHGLQLPKGVVAGVALEAVLRRLTVRQRDDAFDRLPIPFRALATDLANAQPVVIDSGSLAGAIRTSMAIPGLVAPVERDGRLLADGGLARNLPVDVARAMGADIIIAVNIGTPLQSREELTSLLRVSEQMVRMLITTNTAQSLRELGSRDILIAPELGDLPTGAFDRLLEAAGAGERAARAMARALAPLQVSPDAYAAYTARREADPVAPGTVDGIRVSGTQRVHPDTVRAAFGLRPGAPFDPARADAGVRRLYAHGDFERVNYFLDRDAGGRQFLHADVTEKSWGQHTLRAGFGLSSDFRGDAQFDLLLAHRMGTINAFGGEWRNLLQTGRTDRLLSELYQPFDLAQRSFGMLEAETVRDPFDLYVDERRVGRYRRIRSSLAAALGLRLGADAELRIGLSRGHARMATETGIVPGSAILPPSDVNGATALLRYDTLDSLRFPRAGQALELRVFKAVGGATPAYTRFDLSAQAAVSRGKHTLRGALTASHLDSTERPPAYELGQLGGFLRLSGYRNGEFVGTEERLARVVYTYRVAGPGLFDGAQVGVSSEFGRIRDILDNPPARATLRSNAVFVGADTLLGPLYFGYGRARHARDAVYLFLGLP